jgi:hypothetical protein
MTDETPRRRSYVIMPEHELDISPLYVSGYSTAGKFVCRLEISRAGVAVYNGSKGVKKLCDYKWEDLVKKLSEP